MEAVKKFLEHPTVSEKVKNFIYSKEQVFVQNHQFYLKYTNLFTSSSQQKKINEKHIELLNVAGFLYYLSIIMMDKIFDKKDSTQVEYAGEQILINAFQEEAVKVLSSIFDLKSDFWLLWNQRKDEYFNAVKIESSIVNDPSYSNYILLADYKSAFGKVAIDALHVLSGKKDNVRYNDLLKSHKYFSIGLQLIDDIQDIKEDLENDQFNWAYNKTLIKLKEEGQYQDRVELNTVKKFFYVKGIAIEVYEQALQNFNKAKKYAASHQVPNWIKIIDKKKLETAHYIDKIEGFLIVEKVRQNLARQTSNLVLDEAVLKSNLEKLEEQTGNAFSFVLNQWKKDYSEVKHIMYLSALDGFSGKEKVHIGDVFQRALIADVYCDLEEIANVNLGDVIEYEVKYLISKKLKTRVGGWRYFPDCPEISADADDLGQVMQVLQRAGYHEEIKNLCNKPVEILLKDRTNKDGGIETWIIPKSNNTKQEKKQAHFNETKWGKGPDNEVMANFLYGLCLHDFDKYKTQIIRSCNFLFGTQHQEGYWESRWYYGPYYGTYACLRLFQYHNITNENVDKALKYVINTQNKDGGWGINGESDPLNTALALLCIRLFATKNDCIKNGINYLKKSQRTDGSWNAVQFIKPRTNDPYKSVTLTTAYVLKALVKCQ
jgi:squalene-hopene/tetraprenyl-beta-curcumene cyclase